MDAAKATVLAGFQVYEHASIRKGRPDVELSWSEPAAWEIERYKNVAP